MIEPFSGLLFRFIWLSKLSKWRKKNPFNGYNDFYTPGYVYENRYKVYSYLMERYSLKNAPINYIEFGVEEGNSLKWWFNQNKNPDSLFFGLDTFTGLPEEWGNFKKGDMAFSAEDVKIDDARTRLIKGLFQHTANTALEQLKPSHRTIFHLDADLFSSTLFALTQSYRFMKSGDLLIFDEFSAPTHEFQAFHMFTDSFKIRYKVVAAATNYSFVAVELKSF